MCAKRRRFGWKGILGSVVILLILLVTLLILFLSPIATSIANSQLPKQLHTDAAIDRVSLSLFKGTVQLHGLRIAHPHGFGDGYLLHLPDFSADVAMRSLFSDALIIEAVEVRDAFIHLIKNAEGALNAEALGPPEDKPSEETAGRPGGREEADNGDTEMAEEETPTDKKEDAVAGKPIRIEQLNVHNLTFSYTDHAVGDTPLVLTVTNIDLIIENLLVDAQADPSAVAPGKATLTAVILQDGRSNAYFGAQAYMGPVGGAVPALNAQVRLVGFELETLGGLVPRGAGEALGGSAFDTSVNSAMAEDILDVSIRLVTIANHTIALNIGGTPAEPQIDKSALLFNVFGRGGGTVLNVAGNVAEAGVATAGTALKTAGNLGKDTGKAAAALGKGLFGTVQNVATGEFKEGARTLGETGKSVVTDTAGAVTDTGKNLGRGVAQAGQASIGGERAASWRAGVGERWRTQWKEARESAAEMPYPPQPLETRWETDQESRLPKRD